MLDILIKNTCVVDGTGNPWYRAEVGIKDGRIALISHCIEQAAARVIDAGGMVTCPGFIDVHTHSDRTALVHRTAASSVHQGVTTEGVGQCGMSPYPLSDAVRHLARKMMAEMSHVKPSEHPAVDWTDLEGWRSAVNDNGISINLAPYVGHGTLRTLAMGPEGKGGEAIYPTSEQMNTMKALLERAMDQGAFGMSTGLRYAPGRNSTTAEVVELVQVASRYGGVHISHMRSEEEFLISAVREIIEISDKASIRSSITHHKAMFPENWGKPNETLRMLDRAREQGTQVVADQYPWLFSSMSNLNSHLLPVLPARETAPDTAYITACLRDDAVWAKMYQGLVSTYEDEVRRNRERKDSLIPQGVMVPDIWDPAVMKHIAYSPAHPEIDSMSLGEAARALGEKDAFTLLRRLYLDDEGRTLIKGGDMCEEDLIAIMKWPYTSVSTDSWIYDDYPDVLGPGSTPHPRNYGSFPIVLQRYTRDLKVLRLEDAVRKMTSLPAAFLGLKDRGTLREGACADLVVFDPQTVRNNATYAEPCRHPDGIPYVLVNGAITIDSGIHTGAMAGRVLRRDT
jgi:N-acyl-D-aspartate/D-glutamate deacylase